MLLSATGRDVLRAAAMEYGEHGWRVTPAHYPYAPGRHRRRPAAQDGLLRCACGLAGCPTTGRHPLSPDWLREASTDRAAIDVWWWGPRPWNIAVVTGELFDVWTAPAEVAGRAASLLGNAGRALGPVAYSPDGRWLFCTEPALGRQPPPVPPPLGHLGQGDYLLAPPSTVGTDRMRWWQPPFGPGACRPAPWEPILEALLAAARFGACLARSE
ncbi:MAG TPA: bifunctional DNA primase/polymerase [Mycobacteriales bacterium]|nr:bifunctional DNA primase/polymerase [Mycobacteriales bacterium]